MQKSDLQYFGIDDGIWKCFSWVMALVYFQKQNYLPHDVAAEYEKNALFLPEIRAMNALSSFQYFQYHKFSNCSKCTYSTFCI